jgi:hypothetical protein
MPNLASAYAKTEPMMKPQKQGTCALYSFWYATLLLNQINPARGEIAYPRISLAPANFNGVSTRNYLKHGLNFAPNSQGEVLSADEMTTIVESFGYDCDTHLTGGTGREAFITASLQADKPVAFAFLNNLNTGLPASGIGPNDPQRPACGPHWGLIYAEIGNDYRYLNPHYPSTPRTVLKSTVLASNACVDDIKYVRFWGKDPTTKGLIQIGDTAPATPPATLYDIGPPTRQNLNNVLVAIY